jgi:two-component sensor histidine kinase
LFCGCVLHEVATNAAKDGSLSTSGGMISIAWDTEGPNMILAWTEQGGLAAQPPLAHA